MEKLSEELYDLSGKTKVSSLKGKIGENCIQRNLEALLTNYFSDAELINTSTIPNKSDFHFKEKGYKNIWIEVKTYKRNVPSSEITKFIKELKDNKIMYGIFASTTSGINTKNKISIEEISYNQYILFIPNCGLDGLLILQGIIFLRLLNKFECKTNKFTEIDNLKDKNKDVKKLIKKVLEKFEKIKKWLNESTNLRKQIQTMQKNLIGAIDKQCHTLLNSAIQCEINARKIIDDISYLL